MKKKQHIRYDSGQAVIAAVLFFLVGSLVVLGGVAAPVLRDIRTTGDFVASRQSFSLAEGGIEDVTFRLIKGKQLSSVEQLVEGSVTASTSAVTIVGGREVLSDGDERSAIRKAKVTLSEGAGTSFNYGIQSDAGGISLEDSSTVSGNIYSNGSITGETSNTVGGDVISAGTSGLLDNVHTTGTARANVIQNSQIDGDAYYQTISGTVVGGVSYPGSPDQATTSLPISDATISQWEQDAQAGGIITSPCPYKITGNTTLGPIKINCDLSIENNASITLSGVVWVVGDIEIEDDTTIQVNSSLGNKSVQLIADDPSNRTTGSTITLKNDSAFVGSGTAGSYVLAISQNDNAEQGGNLKAIEVKNRASGDLLLYAKHGKVVLKNSISVKGVTGYKIQTKNSATVSYESGLANLLFTSGPSGGFTINGWSEIK